MRITNSFSIGYKLSAAILVPISGSMSQTVLSAKLNAAGARPTLVSHCISGIGHIDKVKLRRAQSIPRLVGLPPGFHSGNSAWPSLCGSMQWVLIMVSTTAGEELAGPVTSTEGILAYYILVWLGHTRASSVVKGMSSLTTDLTVYV